ncbi:Glutamate 5-kinase, partial [Coemansia spiralis]
QRGPHRLAFSNDPQFYGINGLSSSGSSRSLPTAAAAAPSDPHSSAGHTSSTRPSGAESACTDSKDSTASPDEGLTIAVSTPLRLNPDRRGPRQNMQPCASSGMNTPDHYTPPDTHHHSPLLNPVSRLAQEVGASLQLDQGARRPGHGRTPSAGTPSSSSAALRRTGSAVLVTNVDKHGGPRRRRSKNSMRSTSRSQSRPVSPSGSACSDISSAAGKSLTIVLKLGTSSICDPITHMPLLANLSLVVETICKLKDLGHRVVLVSSGAVGMGMRRLNMASRPKELAVVQVSKLTDCGHDASPALVWRPPLHLY